MRQLVVVFVLSILVSTSCFGQEIQGKRIDLYQDYSIKRHHSFQFNPISILIGGFSMNYEYLIGKSGIVAELGVISSDFESLKKHGVNAQLAYRRHFKPTLNSFYHGPFFTFKHINAHIGMEKRNSWDYYDVKYSGGVVGYSIGKKWIFGSGFGIGLRLGAGFPFLSYEWDSKLMNDYPYEYQEKQLSFEHSQNALSIWDSEFTLGFSF